MKEDIRALLDRREEITKEINKLQKEYEALGNAVKLMLDIKEKEER